jgi:hypothetical protein
MQRLVQFSINIYIFPIIKIWGKIKHSRMVNFVDKLCSKTKTLSKQIDQNLMEEETLGVIYLEKKTSSLWTNSRNCNAARHWVIIPRLPNLNLPNKLTNWTIATSRVKSSSFCLKKVNLKRDWDSPAHEVSGYPKRRRK